LKIRNEKKDVEIVIQLDDETKTKSGFDEINIDEKDI